MTRIELAGLFHVLGTSELNNLHCIRPELFSQTGINFVYKCIINTLLDVSRCTLKLKNNASCRKFWWDRSLQDAKRESIYHYSCWQAAGRPNEGIIYDAKKLAHRNYKNAVHKSKSKSKAFVTEKLQTNLLQSHCKKFWRLWKSSFKNNGMQNKMNINDLNDDPAIANYLASSFKSACTPNDEQKENEFRNKYFSTKAKNIGKESSFIIDVESVDRSINRIACNKAAGFDSVSIENIKYAHPSLVIILNTFFNILLFTGLVPDDFGTGVTTPIPKFKGNKKSANADDFRGITICPVISKVFEHCLKEHFENINTSIRQFGFKEGVGCNNSLHSVRKVVRYFNNRKSTVNL